MPVAGLLWKTYSVSTLAPASRITKIPTTWSMPFSHSESIKSTKMKQKHHLPIDFFPNLCKGADRLHGSAHGWEALRRHGHLSHVMMEPHEKSAAQPNCWTPTWEADPNIEACSEKNHSTWWTTKNEKIASVGVHLQQNRSSYSAKFHLPSQVALDSPIQRSHSPSNVNSQADGDPKDVSETNTMWDSTQTWIKSACKSMDTTTVCIGTLLKTLQCIGAPTNLDRFLKHWGFTRKWHSIWNVKCTKLGRNGQRR